MGSPEPRSRTLPLCEAQTAGTRPQGTLPRLQSWFLLFSNADFVLLPSNTAVEQRKVKYLPECWCGVKKHVGVSYQDNKVSVIGDDGTDVSLCEKFTLHTCCPCCVCEKTDSGAPELAVRSGLPSATVAPFCVLEMLSMEERRN